MPLCFGASGLERVTSMPQSARWAIVFHTFCPLTIHSSPSRTALHASPAKSLPAPGSLNSWHQRSSPVNIGRRNRWRCSSVPWVTIVGPASARKNDPGSAPDAPAARSRWSTTFCRSGRTPKPPNPAGKCTHASPASYWCPRNSVAVSRRGSWSAISVSTVRSINALSGSAPISCVGLVVAFRVSRVMSPVCSPYRRFDDRAPAKARSNGVGGDVGRGARRHDLAMIEVLPRRPGQHDRRAEGEADADDRRDLPAVAHVVAEGGSADDGGDEHLGRPHRRRHGTDLAALERCRVQTECEEGVDQNRPQQRLAEDAGDGLVAEVHGPSGQRAGGEGTTGENRQHDRLGKLDQCQPDDHGGGDAEEDHDLQQMADLFGLLLTGGDADEHETEHRRRDRP